MCWQTFVALTSHLSQILFCYSTDVTVQPPTANSSHQFVLQSDLQNMFKCAQEGWTKEFLHDVNLELVITDGSYTHSNTQHEAWQPEMETGKPAESQRHIKPSNIFKHGTTSRTVLTIGTAGTGKSFLVKRFLLDWAEKRANQNMHLLFPFSVQELNLWRGETFLLAELIHTCIPETKSIKEETLNDIFTTLQNSKNSDFDQSEFKRMFVFDGLEERHLQLDFTSETTASFDVRNSAK